MCIRPNKYQLGLEKALSEALEREEVVTRERDSLLKERAKLRKQLKGKSNEKKKS